MIVYATKFVTKFHHNCRIFNKQLSPHQLITLMWDWVQRPRLNFSLALSKPLAQVLTGIISIKAQSMIKSVNFTNTKLGIESDLRQYQARARLGSTAKSLSLSRAQKWALFSSCISFFLYGSTLASFWFIHCNAFPIMIYYLQIT